MKPLGRLSTDPDSEEDKYDSEDEQESEPPSTYAAIAIVHLQSMYQKLYTGKQTKDFADRWQGFA